MRQVKLKQFQKMALETKGKRLITEPAAVLSQIIHTYAHTVHTQRQKRTPQTQWINLKWNAMFQRLSYRQITFLLPWPHRNGVPTKVPNLNSQGPSTHNVFLTVKMQGRLQPLYLIDFRKELCAAFFILQDNHRGSSCQSNIEA